MRLFSATGSLCHVYTVSAHLCDSNIWLIASLSPYLNTSAITCSDTSSSASPCAEDTCYLRTRCHLTRDSASYVRCLASSPTPTLNSANRKEVRVNWSNGPELWPEKRRLYQKDEKCVSLWKSYHASPPSDLQEVFSSNMTTVSTFHRFNFLKPKWLALFFKDFLKLKLSLSGAAFASHA